MVSINLLGMRRAKGFSLLEMVLAGVIFATVAVALSGVFTHHYRAVGSSRLFLVAQHLARTKTDEFIAAGFDKIAETVIPNGTPVGNPNMGSTTVNAEVSWTIRDQEITTSFEVESSYEDVVLPAGNRHRVCTARVSWLEEGRTRNVHYTVSISEET